MNKNSKLLYYKYKYLKKFNYIQKKTNKNKYKKNQTKTQKKNPN